MSGISSDQIKHMQDSLLSLMLGTNLVSKSDLMRGKTANLSSSDKKSDLKREAEKDRQIKRISVPAQLRLLASLEIPLQMVDPTAYLEVAKKALVETLPQAKLNKFTSLEDSIEKAISKCDKMLQKGYEEYVKKRKDKDLNEYDLIQLLKQPNCIKQLEDIDLAKIKNSSMREKVSGMLAKRGSPEIKDTVKDKWENDYFAYYKNKQLKTD